MLAVLASLAVVWAVDRVQHPPRSGAVPPGSTVSDPSDIVGESVGAAFTDPTTAAAALLAGRTAVQTVDSYDYRTFARDRAAGRALTTGVFQAGYDTSMNGSVQQHALQTHTVQSCTVQRVGLVSLDGKAEQAVVLVFAVLSVTDDQHADAQTSPVSLNVTLQLVDGNWLIAAMADVSQLVQSQVQPPGNAELLAAAAAGRQAVDNLINYRRARFAADFQRSLTGLDATAAEQQKQNESSIRAQLSAGNYDLVGSVAEVAVEDAGFDAATLLVTGQRYQQTDDGNHTALPALRAEVPMIHSGSRWLVAQFTTVGVD